MDATQVYRDALGQILNGAACLGGGEEALREAVQGIQKIAAAALLGNPVPVIWEVNRLAEPGLSQGFTVSELEEAIRNAADLGELKRFVGTTGAETADATRRLETIETICQPCEQKQQT